MTLNDADLVLFFIIALAAGCGACGGLVSAFLALWLKVRLPRTILRGLEGPRVIDLDVQFAAQPVRLPIAAQQPDPIIVEVITAGAPTTRELAARVIAAMPAIGPTDLASICQCSKSTAHAIIKDAREGRLTLPTVPEPEEGEL